MPARRSRNGACSGNSYSFVIVSSRFKMARLTIAHAANLCRFTSAGSFGDGTAAARAVELWSSKYLNSSSQKSSRAFVSAGGGQGARAKGKSKGARGRLSEPPSFKTRKPIAWAASTNVFSLSVVSACKGVFERTRRVQEFSAGGASKASNVGKGRARFQNV